DDIRGESDYDHPTWHYIDYPFKPAGQSEEVETEQPSDQNIETAFRTNVEIVKSDATDAEKAIAVCWILHLLGDGHQPLHAVSLFSKDYPKGDQGGNKEFIRVKPDGKPLKLHRFWDGVVSGSEDTRDLHKIAIELRHNYPRQQFDPHPESVTPANFADWIQESAELARTKVYLNGQLAASPDRDNAPTLPDEYVQQAKILGEQRVTLAGYRIADILAKLFQ
ncbi:MAG TPA: S1/P1 nuclease, partial [Pirellulales bacterium]